MGSKKRQDASKKGTEKSSKKDTTQKSQPSTPSNNSKRKSESAKDTSQTAGSSTRIFIVLLILGTLTAGTVYVYINNIGDSQIILGNFRESIEASFTSIFKSTPEKQTAKQPDKKQTSKQADKKQTKKDNAAEKENKPTKPSTQESEASNKAKESKPYAKASITNSADQNIQKELDTADDLVQRKPNDAIKKYDALLQRYPQSPRAIFGKAEALSRLAELERSNRFLEQSINQYQKVLDVLDVPDELFKKAARTCRDKMQFRGWMGKAVKVMQQASLKFFTDNALRNELGVAYLMMGRNENARGVFQQVVDQEPHNGYALVHLAFVVKTMDLNYEKAIPMFIEGLESGDEGTDDGRFYFHLGEALQRLNRTEEAYEWYQKGADRGHFKSAYQRSLYNINSLTSQAWWDPQKTKYHTYIKYLETVIVDMTQVNKNNAMACYSNMKTNNADLDQHCQHMNKNFSLG
ncbi:unnamed protein product [Owenia fusiformis]|uniref:Uncharacterized protein n=1 Tax=Owenia fusiformis TaxID=6347 RepID=A0A8J1Y0I0_OWEFU|nr:unnamed protein product [Owenia fusiformis]